MSANAGANAPTMASLTHTFTTDGLTVDENADQYVAAWNASTDSNVSLYTASNSNGTITITEDVATTGTLTSSSSIFQIGGGSDLATTSASVTAGISALTAEVVDGGTSAAATTMAAGTTGVTAVAGVDAVAGSSVNTLDISTAAGAAAAITSIDLAIAEVGAERANLGAFQNRLEHTVSNMSSMIENTSAARSRIQDADFAVESANLAKNQVLQQAGTAMLAQANASGQGVLSLLK
jgi:flagellin